MSQTVETAEPGAEEQPEPVRRGSARRRVAVLAGVVVAGAAVVAAAAVPGSDAGIEATGLSAVRAYENLDRTHIQGDVTYPHSPPVGGLHDPKWLECGVYSAQVREENVVHDLEHGTVLITYEPGLDDDGIATLAALLPDNGILSPWPEQGAPVKVTVWGRQLDLTGPEDPRLPLFIEAFGHGETAPEPFASCAGGLDDPDGTGDRYGDGSVQA
ncbi:DUF3105 domain-containing protein [Nocardioides bruguierae]|uniref:DUF3105 domain-containing protein n=1 Tax=Nocardioides bruguierae TaxID=2945102 RepID=UPI002020F620|nr:DUF3105 domain-containing protein [Nocardioides bruguierae]MCL8024364.1 DUF3105 domain-containing protein [Nocardioides bruguierae]